MANEGRYILLGADGEPHTEAAVRWSLDLAAALGLGLRAVHVRDPYLKQFYNDIYAQGREEYLAHVQDCNEEKARRAEEEFGEAVRRWLDRSSAESAPEWTFEVLDGDPAKRFGDLVAEPGVAMVVVGRRGGQRRTFRARDLGERLSAADHPTPLVIIPVVPR